MNGPTRLGATIACAALAGCAAEWQTLREVDARAAARAEARGAARGDREPVEGEALPELVRENWHASDAGGAGAPAAGGPPVGAEEAEAVAAAIQAAAAAAFTRRDADALAALYADSPHTVVLLPGGEARGIDAVRALLSDTLGAWEAAAASFAAPQVLPIAPDAALVWGAYDLRVVSAPRGGKAATVTSRVRYLHMVRRDGDAWKIVAAHESASPPPRK